MDRHVCTAALLLLALVGVMGADNLVFKSGVTGEKELEDGQAFSFDSTSTPLCKRIVFDTDAAKYKTFATAAAADASGYASTAEGFTCDKKWREAARTTVNNALGTGTDKVAADLDALNTKKLGKKVGEVQFYLVAKGSCETNPTTGFSVYAAGASRGSLLLVWAVCLLMAVMHFGRNSNE